jgi:Ca-activated chloride channel family protein
MNPRVARVALAVVGVLTVALASAFALADGPGRPLEVSYVYSTDAADLLEEPIRAFNDEMVEVDGRPVHVTGEAVPSGDARTLIRSGGLQPTAWTPASSMWGRLIKSDRVGVRVEEVERSLVQSPQVVVIIGPKADDLNIESVGTLEDLLERAKEDITLAHTDPNVSTSGLSAVLSEFSIAASIKPHKLASKDVDRDAVEEEVRGMEMSMSHYVDVAKDFADIWCEHATQIADGAYMQETTLLKDIRGRKGDCERYVPVYPSDVSLVADYPLLVLDAPWVSEERAEGARVFSSWLEERLAHDCPHVRTSGFRKGDCVPGGVRRDLPADVVDPPPGKVLAKIQRAWSQLRRPANVMLVVDQSKGMGPGGRLRRVREAISSPHARRQPFVDCPVERDRVGLIAFGAGDGPEVLVELNHYGDGVREQLTEAISSLQEERGRPALDEAVAMAVDQLEPVDASAINTVVVLSLGTADTEDGTHGDLVKHLEHLASIEQGIQVLGVAFAHDHKALDDLVEASIGRPYDRESGRTISDFICQFL